MLQLAWWLIFGAGLFMLISTTLPAMRIELSEERAPIPQLLTRKYTSLAWNEIVEVQVSRHSITFAGEGKRAEIVKLGLSDAEWAVLLQHVADRVGDRVRPS